LRDYNESQFERLEGLVQGLGEGLEVIDGEGFRDGYVRRQSHRVMSAV